MNVRRTPDILWGLLFGREKFLESEAAVFFRTIFAPYTRPRFSERTSIFAAEKAVLTLLQTNALLGSRSLSRSRPTNARGSVKAYVKFEQSMAPLGILQSCRLLEKR